MKQEPEEKTKPSGAQIHCALDSLKPYQRYKHLTGVGRKKSQVAAAALGRELAGFVWAIGRMVKPREVKAEAVKK